MKNTAEKFYDFALFEEENKSAARHEERVKLKVIKNNQRKLEKQKKAVMYLAIIMCFVMTIGCTGYLYEKAQYDVLLRQKNELEMDVESVKSDNIRIKAEIDSSLSIDKVNKYATEELGMVKMENFQIHCIDLSKGDRVVKHKNKNAIEMFFDDLFE